MGRQVAEVEDSSRRLTAQREAQVLQGVPTHRCSEPLTAIEEVVEPLQTLAGHEGSIYRLTWAIDGLTLVSVSDDRRLVLPMFTVRSQISDSVLAF